MNNNEKNSSKKIKNIKIPLVFGILMFSVLFLIYSIFSLPEIKIAGATTTNTTDGMINLTITKIVAIELIIDEIDFGSFYVNTTCGTCYMDTNGNLSLCCVGANNVTSGFEIQNTGNTFLSISIDFEKNATEFIGHENASLFFLARPDSDTIFGGQNGDTEESCSGRVKPDIWTEVNTTTIYICGSTDEFLLSPINSKDAIILHMKFTVPPKITGRKENLIIFTGTAAS